MRVITKETGTEYPNGLNAGVIEFHSENKWTIAIISNARQLTYKQPEVAPQPEPQIDPNDPMSSIPGFGNMPGFGAYGFQNQPEYVDDITVAEVQAGTAAVEAFCKANNLNQLLVAYKKNSLNVEDNSTANLSYAKQARIAEVNNSYTTTVQNILGEDVPYTEMQTWSIQEAEARAFLSSKNPEDAPTMSAIAKARNNLNLTKLCEKSVQKSELYRKASSYLIGYRQGLVDRIQSATDVNSVNAISWNPDLSFLTGAPQAKPEETTPAPEQPAKKIKLVKFNANGGEGAMEDVSVELGEYTIPAPTFKAPNNKQFKVWLGSDKKEYQPLAKITFGAEGEFTFTAQYEDVTKPATDGTIDLKKESTEATEKAPEAKK